MPRRSLKGSKAPPPKDEDEEVYEMEDVMDYVVERGKERFLVKWKGYPSSENTWEPVSNILEPSAKMRTKMQQFREKGASRSQPPPPPPPAQESEASGEESEPEEEEGESEPEPEPIPEKPKATKGKGKAAKPAARTAKTTAAAVRRPSEPRGVKRKPPTEEPSESPTSGKNEAPRQPEGSVTIHHMGRGPPEAANEYNVALKWDNGFTVTRSVSYVRQQYPDALLDYLLTRVRFRNNA